MRQEIALESDGAPVVRAFLSDERQLVFRYLTVRPGGGSVWVPVEDKVLREVPRHDEPDFDKRLRAISLSLARSIGYAEERAPEQTAELRARLDDAERRLAEAEAEAARADARLAEAEVAQVRLAELEAAEARRERAANASAAAKAKRRQAA